MIWHIILLLLSPLAALVSRLMPDHRDREILALRQQVLVLQRQLGKRPRLSRSERFVLLLTFLRMKKQRLTDALLVVKPATLVGWHRQIVRRHWTFRQKRKPGRPRIAGEVEQLVLQIADQLRDPTPTGRTVIPLRRPPRSTCASLLEAPRNCL